MKKLNIKYDFITIDEDSMREIAKALIEFYKDKISNFEIHDGMKKRKSGELTKMKDRLEFWKRELCRVGIIKHG